MNAQLRPLYLENGHGWRVRLDGPALRIDCPGRAAAWHGLRQLSRIVSAEDAQWDTRALLACLRSGIPITFRDHNGRVCGCCYGIKHREPPLSDLLRQAIDQPRFASDLRTWWNGCSQQAMRRALNKAGMRVDNHHLWRNHNRIVRQHSTRLGFECKHLLRHMRSASSSLIAQHLQQQVDSAWLLDHPLPDLNLATLLADWLNWRLHEIVLAEKPTHIDASRLQAEAVRLTETHAKRLEMAIDEQLRRLQNWLREYLQ